MDSLFEALIEIFLQVFGDAILDAFIRSRNPVTRAIGNAIVAAIFGSIFGLVSVFIYPHHIIRNHSIRLAALLLMPLLNGYLMERVGTYFSHRGETRSGFEQMLPAAIFSLVFGAIRFQLAR